jgi:2-C-methyl-D-erythritol 4-phosphate cytidylyltransferase
MNENVSPAWSWGSNPVVVVILAAGFGTRFDPQNPKQLISVGGEAIISRVIRIFETNPHITDIVVGVNSQVRANVAEIVRASGFSKVRLLVDGGKERSDSSYACLKELAAAGIPGNAKILIQDGVRPFTAQEVIDDCVAGLESFDALSTAIRSTDTIYITRESEGESNGGKGTVVDAVPERSVVYRAQTPQAFRFSTIFEAYQKAMGNPVFKATDDAGVVIRYMPSIQIGIVEGNATNMKITTLDDLSIAELISNKEDCTHTN